MKLKKIKQRVLFFIVLGLLFAQPVQSKDDDKWQAIFQLDNDLFSGSDRDYTNGVRFAFIKEIDEESVANSFLKRNLRKIVTDNERVSPLRYWLLPQADDVRFAWGVGLTQLMFTPEDFTALSAPEGERPYAGWLGLEYSLHAKNESKVNSITLSVGVTGEDSFAQESQEWVHENLSGSPQFQGWDSQIPGEVTLNFHFDHKQRILKDNQFDFAGLEFDGYYESGLSFGNFRTDAYVGGVLRAGINLPSSFSTPRVQLGSYGHDLFETSSEPNKRLSVVGFVGARATVVAHDITLDGPLFREFDTGVESETLVGELLFGFDARYHNFALSFTQTIRSDEFDGQTENQIFGSLMLRAYTLF